MWFTLNLPRGILESLYDEYIGGVGYTQFCVTHMKWEQDMLCSVGKLKSTLAAKT